MCHRSQEFPFRNAPLLTAVTTCVIVIRTAWRAGCAPVWLETRAPGGPRPALEIFKHLTVGTGWIAHVGGRVHSDLTRVDREAVITNSARTGLSNKKTLAELPLPFFVSIPSLPWDACEASSLSVSTRSYLAEIPEEKSLSQASPLVMSRKNCLRSCMFKPL